tara:strand:+ start:875 stop:1207 length:333 start_codon:yes stop_codon:yes gene_type:complete
MKIFFCIIFIVLFSSVNTYAQQKDCSKLKKLSKDYLKCSKDNFKSKSDSVGITEKVTNFKESSTISEFISKDNKDKNKTKKKKKFNLKKSIENFKTSKTIEEAIKKDNND